MHKLVTADNAFIDARLNYETKFVLSVVCCQVEVPAKKLITRPEESYRQWCVVCVISKNLMSEKAIALTGPQKKKNTTCTRTAS